MASIPFPLLRIYPMPFAREVCDLVEDFKATCKGQPAVPHVVPRAIDTFNQLEWLDTSVWHQVDLRSVFNYLRRSRRLKVPSEWKDFVPDKLE